ncbi:MAG: DUF4405 domain-containing protein [Gammaproteobacteria bacterium]
MKKSNLITLIDISAFIGFIFVVSTGVLMRYVLPPRSGRSIEIFGMSRHEWGDIHFYITLIFLIILSVHLILHWKFIRNIFRGKIKNADTSRLFLGIIALLAVLALAVAPLVAPKEFSNTTKGNQYGKSEN